FAAELGQRADRVASWLESASLRRADYWCSVSQYAADKTMQLFKMRSRPDGILYNPVELPPVFDRAPKTGRVVFSGTLTPKKGVMTLVEAWPRVFDSRPDAELHLYGKDGRDQAGASLRAALEASLPEH